MNNDKCEFCKGTGKEPGEPGCVWCHNTGTKEGQALLTPLVQQHQGEPVAWRVGSQIFQQEHLAKMHSGGVRKPVEPLYTHADPGEVERLRAELEQRNREKPARQALSISLIDEARNLRAQLAERDALLRDTKRCIERNDYPVFELLKRIDATLSASAEPSAPAVHPVNMKTIMRAYEQVDHKTLLHGTSNWCAAMATALRGVLCAEPSAPVECDERAEFDPLEWLETEIIAVDTWYRGSPSYEHDAGWMKDQALRLVAEARAALERKP